MEQGWFRDRVTTLVTQWPYNIPNGNKIHKHFPFKDPKTIPKF
jgi:hypothetical protein